MRDYVQKRDGQIVHHGGKHVAGNSVVKPSDLKGRFRLNVSVRETAQETSTEADATSLSQNSAIALPDTCSVSISTSPVTVLGVSFDPFDAYELRLGPESMRLIHHFYNLTENPKDKSGSLFHSIEAFRAINDQLEKGTFADTTIAAVALLATKEVLSFLWDKISTTMPYNCGG
ncbi:hypothetical protein VCV18_012644 [Metarhizium anisopliae]